MRTLLFATAAAVGSLMIAASPAMAASFVSTGDSAFITFNGSEAGTSANLLLTLTGESSLNNTFTFSYTFNNTSNAVLNPTVRIPSFGFNDSTNLSGTGNATGIFDTVSSNANFPNGLGNRKFCVNTGNCLGGNEGVTVAMSPVTGSFTLDYAGSGLTQITLNNFAVRYISTGANGAGSGTGVGVESAVPEPTTWALLILGFGAVGGAMRRRSATAKASRMRLTYA